LVFCQPTEPTLKKPKELKFSIARNEDWKIIYTFGHNRLKQYDKMKSFGKYLRKAREDKELPLRKVAAALDIDTSILSKIERNERRATTEMIPILSETLDKTEKEIQIEYIKSMILTELGELEHLKIGLKETLKSIG